MLRPSAILPAGIVLPYYADVESADLVTETIANPVAGTLFLRKVVGDRIEIPQAVTFDFTVVVGGDGAQPNLNGLTQNGKTFWRIESAFQQGGSTTVPYSFFVEMGTSYGFATGVFSPLPARPLFPGYSLKADCALLNVGDTQTNIVYTYISIPTGRRADIPAELLATPLVL